MELLKFIIAGHVDAGKSTLIGRLLLDSKQVLLQKKSDNLAWATDGLQEEREKNITIDVAYKYFIYQGRKFVIIDAPGHFEYTKNMISGASNADWAVILIDATEGITTQTKRHVSICHLLGIRDYMICINKMDEVDFKENIFQSLRTQFQSLLEPLEIENAVYIPIVALSGDHILEKSIRMPWYQGPTFMDYLMSQAVKEKTVEGGDVQIQNIIHTGRGVFYTGKISQGSFNEGDQVHLLPSQQKATISAIYLGDKKVKKAFSPLSISFQFEQNLSIERGEWVLKHVEKQVQNTQKITALLFWMDEKPIDLKKKYDLLQHALSTICEITKVGHIMNISAKEEQKHHSNNNEFVHVHIKTDKRMSTAPYINNKNMGSFILVDRENNNTVAAGMIQAK